MEEPTTNEPAAAAHDSILPASLAARGPNVIGATGGSGTRVVARIVRENGMFTGERRNDYEDALDFGDYSDRWIDRYLIDAADLALVEAMTEDLKSVVRNHCAALPDDARAWGWKEPRSIYYLPLLHSRMPSLRFVHFIRDGRDMALSDNQTQLIKHGKAVFRDGRPSWRRSVRSIALWNRINLRAADYGERELGPRYLRVRFEDLCAEPAATVREILDFFELDGDAEAAAALVRPPETLGRWRHKGRRLVEALEGEADEALLRFGYR
jgi:hypothetical protein